MAKYRYVYTEFWTDPKVSEEMTPEDKLFWIYCLTNPAVSQIGVYTITKKAMAYELGYSQESVNSLIDRFENHHKLIRYNSETREIAIKNWGLYNYKKGGKPICDAIKADLKKVKDLELVRWALNSCLTSIKADEMNREIVSIMMNFLGDVPKELIDDTFHDTSNDTPTLGEQKENENKNEIQKEKIKEEKEHDVVNSPYQEIVELFNKTCISLPKVIQLTTPRKQAIDALLAVFNDITTFSMLFDRAQNSSYLTGKNDSGWRADFDFLLKEEKAIKVLEGGYDNFQNTKKVCENKLKSSFNNFKNREYDGVELEKMLLAKSNKELIDEYEEGDGFYGEN